MEGKRLMAETARRRREDGQEAGQAVVEAGAGRGLVIPRHFTAPSVDPLDAVEWERRSAVIHGEAGEVVFEQHNVEVPKGWSQLATSVVVSKYFRGQLHSAEREHSGDYESDRSASSGSIRDARHDGRRQASDATTANSAATEP